MNIQIYSECQKIPNEYLNIFGGKKRDEYLRIWMYLYQNIRIYSNVQIFTIYGFKGWFLIDRAYTSNQKKLIKEENW